MLFVVIIISLTGLFPVTNALNDLPQSVRQEYNSIKKLNTVNISDILNFIRHRSFIVPTDDDKVSQQCKIHYTELQEDKLQFQLYALKFLDADGKPGAGILEGNFKWWGSYDECISAAKTDTFGNIIFSGKYCRTLYNLFNIPIGVGQCVPNTCSNRDLYNLFMSNSSLVANLACHDTSTEYSVDLVVGIVLCGILLILLVVGTAVDMVQTQRAKKSQTSRKSGICEAGLISFSIVRNLPKILNTETKNGNIDVLNGIRVLTLFWVILGHSLLQNLTTGNNLIAALSYQKSFDFQAIINATVAVDTFFFISGLLVSFLTLRELHKNNGRMNWLLFYFHRFWRLTPAYMFTLMACTTLVPHLVSQGPVMELAQQYILPCRDTWWANLLYINNFYPGDLKQCVVWSWYLANDMQFYCISPIIIIALYKRPKLGMIIIGLLLVMCLVVRGVIAYEYQISPLFSAPIVNQKVNEHHYARPYYRIAPYLTGLALGYLFWLKKLKITISLPVAIVGWVVAAAVNMSVVYGLWGYYKNDNTQQMDTALVIYQTFHRWAWSMGVAWVVLACVSDYGGWVNKLLSWTGWLPFVRLSYTAYLIHLPVMMLHAASTHDPTHFDIYTIIYKFLADLVMTFMASLVVTLAVESPMLCLEKVLLKLFTPKNDKNTTQALSNGYAQKATKGLTTKLHDDMASYENGSVLHLTSVAPADTCDDQINWSSNLQKGYLHSNRGFVSDSINDNIYSVQL